MSRPPILSIGVAALVAATGLSLVAPAVAGAAPASTPKIGYAANAYGTRVAAGTLLRSNSTAPVGIGCSLGPGTTLTNNAAALSVPGVLSSGAVNTSASTSKNSSTATSETGGVSVLGGLVSASAIKSVSTTTYDPASRSFTTSGEGSQFADLVVAGKSLPISPAPNTKITLPGIGYLYLNQQIKATDGTAGLTVRGISLNVTVANALVPLGVHVYVGSAKTSLYGPVDSTSGGSASGTSANVGSLITTAKTFPVSLPCAGGASTVVTHSGVAASIPGVLSTGTITNTAQGGAFTDPAFGRLTSTIQNVNLLAGVIHVSAIKADVSRSGTNDAGNPASLTDNSSFAGLTIAGLPAIGNNVAPNTTVSPLPGISLTLHKVTRTNRKISVTMIQLQVTGLNLLGLANGTTINIGNASASGH